MIIYIETSALNWLFDKLRVEDAFPTRNYQLYQGRKWVTSSITLWEILNTSDETKRDDLLDFSRRLLFKNLIKSPEEIILTYLKKNCPTSERWSSMESEGLFAKEWYQAANNFDYFFKASGEGYSYRTDVVRKLRETVYSYIQNEPLILQKYQEVDILYPLVISTIQHLTERSVREDTRKDINDISVKIAIIYTFMILCCSFSLDFDYLENFWKKVGIKTLDKRFDYILNKYPDIFFRGPIANLARMTIAQLDTSSRGMVFDAMHTVYLTYVDFFVTADKHFLKLPNVINDHNYLKICHVDEIELFYV